jgi:ankyrin repeat protein
LRREEERRVREEAQKQQELGEKKQVDGEALVESVSKAASANFYTDFDQADSLAGAYATQRHSMIRELAKELRQGQLESLEHKVIADGYLSDEELDCDLTNNMGSGLNFGDTTDHLTSFGPQKEGSKSKEAEQGKAPLTPDALSELLRDKRKYAQGFARQEQALQRDFHELLLEGSMYLTAWQNTAVESYTDPDLQVPLQNLHKNILALFPVLSNWETSLKNLEKALEDWESNLHEPDGDSWLVERDLKDHEKLVEHFEKAQQTFADTQSQYKTFLPQICTHVYTPHYHTALTTPLLQQQALSLAQTLIQESNHAVAATEQTLKQADQACQKAQTHDTKARGQLENVCKKLIRKRVEVMAHTLDHQPLLDYLAGKSRKYINEKDDQGKTALHYAITQNQLELVQWLLDHGADKEARDKDGLTPLHWASREGHTPTVALLLAANADVAAKHKNAYTPLHFAADRGHTDVVKILLNAEKVDIEAKDEEGLTPLYQSVINNHTAVSKLLLARNADIAAKDQWGSTPLHRAVLEGHLATVALLLEY